MSGRRREGLTPTLFPFLAVLVCTLGTLILLLAMVAQNAGEAIAASESRTPGPTAADRQTADEQDDALLQATAQIDRQLREAQWYREQTVKMRDEQTAELEQRRDQLAHLEDHLRRLREQLQLLSTEVEASLAEKGDAQSAQATLDQLLTQIEAEKETIGNLEQELQSQTPRIVIVPHQGPNGTDRRPIYIQCRSDGVYLQPGGQRIGREHLDAASGRGNPLDAALRAIRHHAMQTYGDSVAPYPLLVVSPDGIETYAGARAAMNAWDDQFGYELVPEGIELAFPAPDPVLDDKVATAIRQAMMQREALALRSGRGNGGQTAGEGRYAAQASGPTTTGGGSAAPKQASSLPVLSAARMSRGDLPSGANYPGASGPGAAAAAGGGNTPGGTSSTLGSGTASGGDTVAHREAAAEASRRMEQQGRHGQDWNAPSASLLATAPPSGPHTTSLAGGNTEPMGSAEGAIAGSGDQPMALNSPQPSGGASDESGNVSGQASGQTGGAGSTEATAASSASAVPGGSAAAGGSGGTQASGSDSMAASEDQPRNTAGSPSVSFSPSATPPVTRVGKDWGLPSSLVSGRGTEMLRMIRVECHADRFVLLPEGGRGSATTFAFDDGDVNRASLELATAVRDRAAGWGAAMQGARWQPVLDVAVVRGGETRYQQLLRLMDGSGVMIQARGTR